MTESPGDPRLLSVLKLGLKLVVDYVRWLHLGPVVFAVVVVSSFFLLPLGAFALGPLFEVPGLRSVLEPYVGTSIQVDQDDIVRFWKSAWPYLQVGAAVAAVLDETVRRMAGTSPLRALSRYLGIEGPWPPLQRFLVMLTLAVSPVVVFVIALAGLHILPQVAGVAVLVLAVPVGWIVFVDYQASRIHRKIDRMEWEDIGAS